MLVVGRIGIERASAADRAGRSRAPAIARQAVGHRLEIAAWLAVRPGMHRTAGDRGSRHGRDSGASRRRRCSNIGRSMSPLRFPRCTASPIARHGGHATLPLHQYQPDPEILTLGEGFSIRSRLPNFPIIGCVFSIGAGRSVSAWARRRWSIISGGLSPSRQSAQPLALRYHGHQFATTIRHRAGGDSCSRSCSTMPVACSILSPGSADAV